MEYFIKNWSSCGHHVWLWQVSFINITISWCYCCVSMKMEDKHKGFCGTMLTAMHWESNCMDLVSMTSKQGVDSTTEKIIGLSLVAPSSDKCSRILMNIVSSLQNPFSFSTPSLPDIQTPWEVFCRNCDLINGKVFPNLCWKCLSKEVLYKKEQQRSRC